MGACARLDDRVCVRGFAVEQGLRQECVLALLLFNIFFAVVINVASTRTKASWTLWYTTGIKGGRGGGGKQLPESQTPLWGMLYADDAGIVSQSPEQPRKMMVAVVVVCAVFVTLSTIMGPSLPLYRATNKSSIRPCQHHFTVFSIFHYRWQQESRMNDKNNAVATLSSAKQSKVSDCPLSYHLVITQS